MGQPIDGHAIAARIRARVKDNITRSGTTPGLAAVLVGDDPASALYVRLKEQAAAEVGVRFELHRFATTTGADVLRSRIRELGRRPDIHGILVQLPLPEPLDADSVISVIPPTKDADGFHPVNLTRLRKGDPLITPPVAKAILALADATGEPLAGRTTMMLANSATFCRPIEWLLRARGADVVRFAPFQPGLHRPEHIARAHLIVSALGCGGCLDAAYVTAGAILIDVGIARLANGTIAGDFNASAHARCSWYTPVPGGVGPVTVAMLLENVMKAAIEGSRL